MRYIILNNHLYELVSIPNQTISTLQFNVAKGDSTFDQIIIDADGNQIIDIYEDEEKVATYTGYATFFCASYIKEQGTVSIELSNRDMQSQINSLDVNIDNIQTQINNVIDDVEEITPTELTQIAYIDDTSIVFENVPHGNISVFTRNTEGNEIDYAMDVNDTTVILTFEPLLYVTRITLLIN